jgi:hypothetical protein
MIIERELYTIFTESLKNSGTFIFSLYFSNLLSSDKANETHLKTPTDFGTKLLNRETGFSTSLDYWNQRKTLIEDGG